MAVNPPHIPEPQKLIHSALEAQIAPFGAEMQEAVAPPTTRQVSAEFLHFTVTTTTLEPGNLNPSVIVGFTQVLAANEYVA
jgi:hypothetical protein